MSTKLDAAVVLERQADELKTKARELRAAHKAEQDAIKIIATGSTGIVYTFQQSAVCGIETKYLSEGWTIVKMHTFSLNDGSEIKAVSYMAEVLF